MRGTEKRFTLESVNAMRPTRTPITRMKRWYSNVRRRWSVRRIPRGSWAVARSCIFSCRSNSRLSVPTGAAACDLLIAASIFSWICLSFTTNDATCFIRNDLLLLRSPHSAVAAAAAAAWSVYVATAALSRGEGSTRREAGIQRRKMSTV